MSAVFSFIHLSDFHLCVEPRRINLLSIAQRRQSFALDTSLNQVKNYGFLSYAKPASYSEQIISAAAQFCFVHKSVVDGLIITGDIATTGHPVDISVARDYTMAPAADGFLSNRQKPTLAASALPTWVIPGNHDKYADNKATPYCKNFELTFRPLMPNFANGVGHKVRRKKDQFLGIVFADFCLRQRADASNKVSGPYGQGRVYTDVLHELEDRTRSLRRKYPGIEMIWSIHFAPYDCGANLALLDWQLVSRSAQMNKVMMTLCGHTHIASVFKSGGHTTYCAGSAGAIDQEDSSRVHIVEIKFGEVIAIRRRNFAWNKSSGEFVAELDD